MWYNDTIYHQNFCGFRSTPKRIAGESQFSVILIGYYIGRAQLISIKQFSEGRTFKDKAEILYSVVLHGYSNTLSWIKIFKDGEMQILNTSIVFPASASPNQGLQHSRNCKTRTVYQRSTGRINVNKCTEDFPTSCICLPHPVPMSTLHISSQPSREAGRSAVLLQSPAHDLAWQSQNRATVSSVSDTYQTRPQKINKIKYQPHVQPNFHIFISFHQSSIRLLHSQNANTFSEAWFSVQKLIYFDTGL